MRASRPGTHRSAGFALTAALLLLIVVSGLLFDVALRARAERRLAWNAAIEVRARAAARAGLSHALVHLRALQALTVSVEGSDLLDAWNRVDTIGSRLGEVALAGGASYRVDIRDPASLLPLNHATAGELRNLLVSTGAGSDAARSTALAAVDHREQTGPFGAPDELLSLAGASQVPRDAVNYLTVVGEGRVNLNTAPEPVLTSLPGMTREAASAVLLRRSQGRFFRSLLELEAGLSAPARAELQREFAALARRVSFEPDRVEITSFGRVGDASYQATLHTIGIRAGSTVQLLSTAQR